MCSTSFSNRKDLLQSSRPNSTNPNRNLHQEVGEESRGCSEHADANRGSGTGDNRSRRGRVAANTANSRGGTGNTAGSEASGAGGTSAGGGSQAGGERGAVGAVAGRVLTGADGKVARAQLLAAAAGDALAPGGLAVVAVGGRGARGGGGARGRGGHGGAVVARAGVVLTRAGRQVAAAELLALAAGDAGLVGRLARVAAGRGRGGACRGRGGGGDGGTVVPGAGVVLAGAGGEITAAELLALTARGAGLVGGLAVVRVVR